MSFRTWFKFSQANKHPAGPAPRCLALASYHKKNFVLLVGRTAGAMRSRACSCTSAPPELAGGHLQFDMEAKKLVHVVDLSGPAHQRRGSPVGLTLPPPAARGGAEGGGVRSGWRSGGGRRPGWWHGGPTPWLDDCV